MKFIKRILIAVLPEGFFHFIRRIEDVCIRTYLGHVRPLVLEDKYGTKFILFPYDRNPISWQEAAVTNAAEFAEIELFLRPGHVVFDVGANIGLISSFCAQKVGADGVVHAFEPHPQTFKELRKTIALNEYDNVLLQQAGMSDKAGSLELYHVNNHKLSSFLPISDLTYGPNQTMKVDTSTIDLYCKKMQIKKIDFLKIDVEGFELQVLRGAQEMILNKAIKIVQFEMRKFDSELVAFFEDHGYKMQINEKGINHYAFIKN